MNLVEAIAEELVRAADLQAAYERIGGPGIFGLRVVQAGITQAVAALAGGDATEMVAALKTLQALK